MKSESIVQQEVQIAAATHHCVLMRNNSGALKDSQGRVVRFGLGNVSKQHSDQTKSSDLIGFTRVQITPDMVGKTIAVFTAVECKKEGWGTRPLNKREASQRHFMDWIRANGGFAGFASEVAHLIRICSGK